MRNRMYDPNLGRFTQTEPILGNRATKHYTYADNNPISFIDPWGEDITTWDDKSSWLAVIAEHMLIDAGISMGNVDEQGRTLIYVPSVADREAALRALKKCALRGHDISPDDWTEPPQAAK